MIRKGAVLEFLNRDLDDFEWIKDVPQKEIERELDATRPIPRFETDPFNYQSRCFLVGINEPKFVWLLDMGLGKTKLILDILRYRIKNDGLGPTLILVPNVILIESWRDEVKKHASDLDVVPLFGNKQQRENALLDDGDIYVINYQGFISLCCSLQEVAGKNKRQYKMVDGVVAKFQNMFSGIVFDESTALKNHTSLTYRLCRRVASKMDVRYALTGTPFGRDPHDLWAQFNIIDDGKTLGPTLGIFREAFFLKKPNYFGGIDWEFDKRREKALNRTLRNRSIRYKASECLDLPEESNIQVRIPMPLETAEYYDAIRDKLKTEKGDFLEVKGAFVRMRQLCSGYLGAKIDPTTTIELEMKDNPKLDHLVEVVSGSPADAKIVVFHDFIYSGKKISERLKKEKIKHVHLHTGTKDKPGALRKFLDDPTYKTLVINSASGSKGLNLQVASYIIFYESPVSCIEREQAMRRIKRSGQKANHIFFYDFVMIGSVEEKILKFIEEGRDLMEALIDDRESVLF